LSEKHKLAEARQVDDRLLKILGTTFSLAMIALTVLCTSTLAQENNSAYTWLDKGNALAEKGDYEGAIKAFNMATELSPQDKHVWMTKGLLLAAHLSRYNESVEAYERALQIDPNDADAWFGKGAGLNKTGKYEEALQSLNRSIELDPKKVEAWKVKGDVLKALGHSADAEVAYAKARELGYEG